MNDMENAYNEKCTDKCAKERQEQYQEFSKNLQENSLAKDSVRDLFKLVDIPEWPYQYYQMKENVWRRLFGIQGTNFLVNYILEGKKKCDGDIKPEDELLLENWRILYRAIVKRAEFYSDDPMGYDDLYSIYNPQKKTFVLRNFRNDGQFLNMTMTPETIEAMMHRLFDVLIEAESVYGRKIDRSRLINHFDKIK